VKTNRCVVRAKRVTALLATLLLLMAHTASASNAPGKKNVLLLYPHHEKLLASQLFDRGLRPVFTREKKANIEFFVEYLDMSRLPWPRPRPA
jgi:hypothetical protein